MTPPSPPHPLRHTDVLLRMALVAFVGSWVVGWWDGGMVGWWDGGIVGWWIGGLVDCYIGLVSLID